MCFYQQSAEPSSWLKTPLVLASAFVCFFCPVLLSNLWNTALLPLIFFFFGPCWKWWFITETGCNKLFIFITTGYKLCFFLKVKIAIVTAAAARFLSNSEMDEWKNIKWASRNRDHSVYAAQVGSVLLSLRREPLWMCSYVLHPVTSGLMHRSVYIKIHVLLFCF